MRILSSAAAIAIAVTSATVAAKSDVVELRISTANLDINTAEGRANFAARAERQARQACKFSDPLRRGPAKIDWNCVETAKADAMAKIASSEARASSGIASE